MPLNDPYRGRTAPLTSKRCILYIYSTNIGTEYFKHGIYSPFFFPPLQNAVCFIILTYLVPVLFTFYIPGCAKIKKKKSGAKRLTADTFMVLCPSVRLSICLFLMTFKQAGVFPLIFAKALKISHVVNCERRSDAVLTATRHK